MMQSENNELQYTESFAYSVERAKPLGATGLQNLGNTCYMNAALQSISNCPHLTEFLLQCIDLFGDTKPRLVTHFHNFLAQLWLPPGCSYSKPVHILREVQCLHPTFIGYGQHDAQEFLRVFLNRLHDELKTTGTGSFTNPRGLKAESGDTGSTDSGFASSITSGSCDCDHWTPRSKSKQKKNRSKHNADKRSCQSCSRSVTADSLATCAPSKSQSNEEESNRPNTDGRSIITDVFQGKLISAVRCLSCGELSCREEPFLDLSLSLRRPEPIRLSDSCLNDSTGSVLSHRKSNSLRRSSRQPLGTTHLALPPSPVHASLLGSRARASPAETEQSRLSQSMYLHSWQPLGPFGYPVSLAKRLFVQIFTLFTLTIAWVFARVSDVRGWVYRPTLTLEDCLADYFSQAELNGDNKYYCERCKKLCNGLNQYALLSLPEVLCVHLKRFRSHYMDASKITSAVMFPLHSLDLSPYLHEDCADKVTTYDLISVICHHGGYGGGHYITYALNWHNQKWYEFDDDHVTEMEPHQIAQMTSEAYILFYRKRDVLLNDLRDQADQMVQEHLELQSDNTVYISRPWFVRFTTWAEPGPITNAEFLCEHGNIQPQLWPINDSFLFPIPEKLWSRLCNQFGGGPVVHKLVPCPKCQDAILERQKHEWDAFEKVYKEEEANSNSCALYAVSTSWFTSWEEFVHDGNLNIPGPIDNSDIADYRPSRYRFSGTLYNAQSQAISFTPNRPRLKIGSDYKELFEGCWNLLLSLYGGGPAICLRPATAMTTPPMMSDLDLTEPSEALDCHLPISDYSTEDAERSTHHSGHEIEDASAICRTSNHLRMEPPAFIADFRQSVTIMNHTEFHASSVATDQPDSVVLLPNGDSHDSPTDLMAVKPDMPTVRSAENLTFPYQGDSHSVLGSFNLKGESTKSSGPWHSQSAEHLNFDQSLTSYPPMAGDGPIDVNYAVPNGWSQKSHASNRKRPRLVLKH